MTQIDEQNLSRHMEFGLPVEVTPKCDPRPVLMRDMYQPEVVYLGEDGQLEGLGQWTPVAGYSAQYGYDGPVMHPSEFLGGGLAKHILSTPGYFMAVVVDTLPADEEEPESVGWAVLYQPLTED